MRKFVSSLVDLFISEDLLSDYKIRNQLDAEEFINGKIDQFFYDNEIFREYSELYAKLMGLKPYAILDAHGDTFDGEWVYYDFRNEKPVEKPVQKWINLRDGKYGSLLISSCNPKTHTPTSRKSLLWISDSYVTFGRVLRDYNFDLIVPNKGIIDSYIIDYELKQLRQYGLSWNYQFLK